MQNSVIRCSKWVEFYTGEIWRPFRATVDNRDNGFCTQATMLPKLISIASRNAEISEYILRLVWLLTDAPSEIEENKLDGMPTFRFSIANRAVFAPKSYKPGLVRILYQRNDALK